MNILIIEEEIYLAQSISNKLTEYGYNCSIVGSANDALKNSDYHIVLLSTNTSKDFSSVIKFFKNSIVILIATHITNDTVTKPIKEGARDYILKPFMMEELIRKIEHHLEFDEANRRNFVYQNYIDYILNDFKDKDVEFVASFPHFIKTNYQKYADAYAFSYAKKYATSFRFISLTQTHALEKIKEFDSTELVYITDFQTLKKSERTTFLTLIKDKKFIISSTDTLEDIDFTIIEIKTNNKVFDRNDILSIEDYVKYIILNYQNRFPDTMLAKKLGISRKSLWEKRKKHDIFKKK